MIRVPQLRVVDEEGTQLGVMPTGHALRLAQDRGYDLVEVAPMAVPPVARLLDYGQFKYEQARREKEARRHQRSVEFKEIRIAPKIGKGDFDTKVRRAIQFLEEGDRVKVTCRFRGREVSHAYIGRDLLLRFGELIKDHGTVERPPVLEGKSMSMVVTSLHKPKSHESTSRPEADESPVERAAPMGTDGPARPAAGAPPIAAASPAGAASASEKARPAAPAAKPANVSEERVPATEPAGG